MRSSSALPESTPQVRDGVDAAWQAIDHVLDDAAQLALTARDADELYRMLLPRAVQATASQGGLVWMASESRELILTATDGDVANLEGIPGAIQQHAGELAREVESAPDRPWELRASRVEAQTPASNCTSLAAPIRVHGRLHGLIELVNRRDTPHVERQSQLAILGAFAEVAAEFHRSQHSDDLRRRLLQWQRANEFILKAYRRLDRRETCYVLANELRQAISSDRVTLLSRRGSRLRISAISNLDTFDPRAAAVRELERAAALLVSDSNTATWYSEGDSIDRFHLEILQPYLDVSNVRSMGIVPLPAPSDQADDSAIGAVVFERFEHRTYTADDRQQVERLVPHAAMALGRVLELERMPLWGLSHALNQLKVLVAPMLRAHHIAWIAAVTVVVAIAAAWPVEFNIHTTGTLFPKERREIFAPADGVVRELAVKQGDTVDANELLLAMDNDDLEAEITRLAGELQTARRQQQVVRASRLDTGKSDVANPEPRGRLAGEEERLKELIQSLQIQYDLRRRQSDELTIRSPISGRVLTWDVEQLLRSRPLKRGQRLMTVANVDGPWQLEMRVADADVGHVTRATRQSKTPLVVEFAVASDPGHEHQATLENVSDWADMHDPAGPSVRMTAQLADPRTLPVRPGAAVTARIQLGQRPRAYVWLRDVIEYVRMRIW